MLVGRQRDRLAIVENVDRRRVAEQHPQRRLPAHGAFRTRADQFVNEAPAGVVGDFHPADGPAAQAQFRLALAGSVRSVRGELRAGSRRRCASAAAAGCASVATIWSALALGESALASTGGGLSGKASTRGGSAGTAPESTCTAVGSPSAAGGSRPAPAQMAANTADATTTSSPPTRTSRGRPGCSSGARRRGVVCPSAGAGRKPRNRACSSSPSRIA